MDKKTATNLIEKKYGKIENLDEATSFDQSVNSQGKSVVTAKWGNGKQMNFEVDQEFLQD